MTREEIQDFLAMIQATYPNFNPPSKTAAVNAWKLALEEYEEEPVHMAFKLYMQTNASGFAPVPGQIIDKIHTMTAPQELNEMEAWSLVRRAICNSIYNSVSEFEKLPPLVQKAVGLPNSLREWAMTENLNHEVVMSNFQRAYKAELKRNEEFQKMPQNVRELIEKANAGSYSAQIAEKRQQAIESASEREQAETKALETKHDGVPMPEKYKERLEDMRNDDERKY